MTRIKYLNLVMFVCLLALLLLSVSFAQSADPYADETPAERGKDFRAGYEETHTGSDLILWLKMKSDKTVRFSISPVDK